MSYYPTTSSNYGSYYPRQGNYAYQAQTQLQKQKVALIQDQNSSNTIMCRVLSELENLVFSFSYPRKRYFGYYATIPNNYQEIINQIIFQLQIFESSFKNFKKINPGKQYIFPNNLQYSNIIEIVNDWKNFLKKVGHDRKDNSILNLCKYYDEFLSIINNGSLSRSFKNDFENLDKGSQPLSQNDLRRVMNAGATATCYTNDKYSEIEEEIAKKGDYKVNVVLMGDRKQNKFYNNMDKYDVNLNNYKKELYNYLFLMLAFLEQWVILHCNHYKQINIKYSKQLPSFNQSKEQTYQKYSEYLDKFYNFYFNNENEFRLEKNEVNNIINDIKSWKSNITDVVVKKELDNAIKIIKNEEFSNK